ncbi:uncharacterized protein LOC141838036 isoform X1 [Curcuma longa]|uniref:uncharacterized protein LOC141838036 isoform X1 n=1 Tax=Curcuma longa TaxID=136217 RepID=UPI003D9E549E
MEIRVEKIEESDIPKKPRSLDLQSIYVKKPRISERKSLVKKEVSVWEVENKAPQKKLGSPLEEDGVVLPKSREKNRKEVSLSSLVPTSKRQPNSSNAPKSNKDHISSVNRSNDTSSRSVTTDNLQGTNADAQHLANDLHSQLSGKTDGAYVTDVSKNKVFMGDSFLAPKQRSGISNPRKSKDPLSLETEISNPCHAKTNTDVQDNESIDKDDLNQKALNDKKRKKKKKVEECDMSGSHKDDSAPSTSAEYVSFIKDENRKAGNRKDRVKMSEQINLGNQARSADNSANSVPVSQDDEENLEENAARMLSSRFDPNWTGFCAKRLKGAADTANDIYFSQSNSERLKGLQGKACSVGSAGRTLRPRRHNGKSFARKRRHFYEVFLRDMDPYCLVKQRIRVFWPLDQNWYFGLIKGYDPVTRLHHVKYDDRDEEWINLQKERFKLLLFPSEVSSKFNFGKPGLEKENKEAEEVDTEESSYLGSLAESEPIISWLARTTRRATSCPSNTTKIHLRVSPLKDTGPSLLLEPPKGSIPMSQLDMKSNNLFLNCKESDQSYDWNINGVSERKRNIDSEEKKLPYVYFRKRFRNKKEDFKTKLTQDAVDCDQGGLASIFPIVNSMSPVWEFKEKLTLVNFQQVIFELSLPLQCTLDFTSQCQSFGLFRSLYIADHGELVCGWPDVHMEVFFVDDIPGLRFILFEGCLKRSISLFCLIIKILNQHVEKCNFTDTEIPCSSIVLCISRLNNSREELLFLNLFSKVESSRWRRFEGKLKKLCTKEASISTPYIHANTLYFSTNEISHSSIKQFEKFWERTNLLHRQDMKKAVDPVLNNFVPCVPEERDKLFPCSLYLANGSSFYPSLYQKLLIEKDTTSGAQTSVSSQKGADNTNTSTIDASSSSFDGPPKQVPARVGRSGPCFSEAAADHISSGIHTWSSGTYGDRYADTSRVNGHQDVVAGIAGSDDVGNITGRGCVLQSGSSPNEAATSVHALHFGSEYAEDSFPLKSHDDRHMISTTNVEAPLLEEVEKHNLQKGLLIHRHCSNLILEMKEHGIHSPTVPRSMWHRNRHTSLSRTFIHSPKLGSMDLMANGTSSGYKRPRTQVSYSVLSGGYEHASKPLNNHQKVHSHKKVKKHVVNASSEYSRSSQNFSDSLLCEANVLITRGDKCWREVGAKIQLDCDDQKTWRIRVQVSDVTKYVYKAYHVLQPGTTNRYTHAMMWKGGNEWTLEFTHRNQWYIFKQIYEACYNQNIRAASVKNIPIPGVRLLSDSNDGFIEVPFARNSLKYIRYIGTEVDFALDPSHVLYDMDSEDEEWISSVRVSMDSADNKIPEVTEDMFEKVMDRFEKLTYTQQCEELTNEDIEKYMADVGQTDSVEVIYDHWRQKRKKKGLPLIRQFQPPLWEQYQQQLKEWELNQSRMPIQSGGGYKKADIMRKPPMFAFCLRPRGLEVPYKDSKQRSHKKLMFNGHHNVLMREQDSFHNLGRKMDGFSLGEATGSSYESSDSYHGLQSRTTFSPKDTASTESLFAHDSSERFLDARYSRSNSKRIEAFLSPRYPQRTPFTYNQKSRNGVNKWSSEFCESSNIKQAPFNGFQRHHADMDEFRLRDATSAAQHALNMAKLKREKAQWLLHKADLSLHRATVALMTADAIKSYEEDIVGDG